MSLEQAYLARPRGPGERASSVPAHRDEHQPAAKPAQWDPWAASLPPSRDLSGSRRVDEPIPGFMPAGSSGLAFGSSPSTPPRRSHDNDSWTSSDLRGQTWSDVVPSFAPDDNSLSPGKRRLDLPRSTSPFHSLQETRHRQATAAQAAALGHESIEEASRALADSALGDRTRGRSMDIDDFSRNTNVDVFQRNNPRNPLGYDPADNTGRAIRANILGSLEDDYSRKNQVPRARVHTLDPSYTLEPLQRANSTPPYSGPLPSSRDLPQSGLNPYPQSRTPQLQSSGHFTTSTRDDPLSVNFSNLNLDSRPGDMGPGRKVSNNILVSNLGAGYPSEFRRPSPQTYDELDSYQDEYNNHWQSPPQRSVSSEFETERRPSPFYNTGAQVQQRPQAQQQANDFQNTPVYNRDPVRQQQVHALPQSRMNPVHVTHPGQLQHHPVLVRDQFYRPQFQTQQFPEFTNGFQPPYSPTAPFIGHPAAMQQMNPNVRRHEDTIRNMRSPLLEEFRAAKNKKFELKDILGHIVEFSGDQHGSRFIQQKLETASIPEKQAVFEEVVPHSLHLMTDVFGNYVIQKFFEYGSQAQKTTLAAQMQSHILRLSLQMYGCRVVQKALEFITPEQQASLIKELDGNTLRCVKDQNGNHVVQKAIERVTSDQVQFIVDSFRGQVAIIASHPYGCRVIQRVLEHCTDEQQKPVLEELHRSAQALIKDQYGNYVIQHVIERGKPEDREKIIAGIFGQVLELSKHKFASNVVEKCVAYGSYQDRQHIIDEITEVHPDNSSPLLAMMKDGFGNYVIQKLLDVTDGEQRAQLVAKVKPQLLALKRYTYGKHLASIERLLLLSESRTPTPGSGSRPSPDSLGPNTIPNQMTPQRPGPELHIVPATPIDLNSPLHRSQ